MNIMCDLYIKKYLLAVVAVSMVSLINPIKADTTLSPGVTIEGIACNVLHTTNGNKRWSILKHDLSEGTDSHSVVYSTPATTGSFSR